MQELNNIEDIDKLIQQTQEEIKELESEIKEKQIYLLQLMKESE